MNKVKPFLQGVAVFFASILPFSGRILPFNSVLNADPTLQDWRHVGADIDNALVRYRRMRARSKA